MNQNQMAVQLIGLSKSYKQGTDEVFALKDISLNIPAGRFVAIMGASGSGKSTLLHIIAGLTSPTAGEVRIFGESLSKQDEELTLFRRRNLGLVFQAFNLLPTMNALDNVCLPCVIDGKNINAIRPEAEKWLKALGLGERIYHRPDQLSGGQQQRVAIARSLITNSPLILADEPTGNLDSKTGETILHLLRKLVNEKQRSLIMVTHDPKAAAYADEVISLNDGQVIDQLGILSH
jgi:putative ABC transport system ATP-binding protein